MQDSTVDEERGPEMTYRQRRPRRKEKEQMQRV